MNPSAFHERADFQGLNRLVESSILLQALRVRAAPPFSCLRNLMPYLLDSVDYALSEGWADNQEWQHHKAQITAINAVLKQNPRLFPRQAPSSIDGNPLGGQIGKLPLLGLLLQDPKAVELQPLATMLKAAVINRILRGFALKTEFIRHLRHVLVGKKNFLNTVIERSIPFPDWPGFWREVRRELGNHRNAVGTDNERINFLETLLELSSVEIESTTDYRWSRIGPQTGVDADIPEPPVVVVASTTEDPSTDDAAPPLLIEKVRLNDLFVPERDVVEASVRAQAARSSYWLATVDEFVPESWSSLTGVERRYLVRTLKNLLTETTKKESSAGAALVLLSFITGQPIERVARFTYGSEGDITASGNYRRCISTAPSAYLPPEDLTSLLRPTTNTFDLHLPDIGVSVLPPPTSATINAPLHDAYGLSNERIVEQAKGFLDEHRLATGYRFTAHRIRLALRHQLILHGRGKFVIHLISAVENDALPIDAYYVAIPPERLELYYRKAVEDLLA